MPQVNPELLRWARETAGLDAPAASQKLGLKAARGATSLSLLKSLESGETEPSRSLLLKMARLYRRPLLAFYMLEPPRKSARGEDFRTLPGPPSEAEEAILDALLRDVRARQSTIRALMEEEDEAVRLPFIGSARTDAGAHSLAAGISSALHFDLNKYRSAADAISAFGQLRAWTEAAGIFVLLIGDLGSHHTRLDTTAFRGYSLADPFAPMVVINDHDARSAWSFSLLHELVHLWLGQTGVSGQWSDLVVERLCNDVASQLLLPAADLATLKLPTRFDLARFQAEISQFADARRVSGTMVAYRLSQADVITDVQWRRLRDGFRDLWLEAITAKRARSREAEGGPNYYVVRRHRVGAHLMAFVARMLHSGALSTSRAAHVLGVKPGNVHRLLTDAS